MNSIKIAPILLLTIALLGCSLPSNAATSTPNSPPTIIPTSIQHTSIPINLPDARSGHAGDYDSSTTASQKRAAGGDRFTYERFERPFNANTMDKYFPQIDIVDTYAFQDNAWIYGTITAKSLDSGDTSTSKYAVELDVDPDGKADWLIIAPKPSSADWSVDGVQAFKDANKDVGNITPMFADANATGDGFETLVFDGGKGDDPDIAWARISPNDPNTIEFAVKRSVLGNPEAYLINMWAGNSLLDPALFDINDHFTHEQAGAADPGFEFFYPIKAVSEIDNSCRMAVGFNPTGNEPGLCEIFKPTPIPAPGCKLNLALCQSQGYGGFDSATCSCVPIG